MYHLCRLFLIRVIFILIFLTGFFISSAQDTPKVWTLEDCINYALDHNLDIKKQILSVEVSKKQLLQSKLNLLPDLNMNATNVWNFGQTIDMYTNTFANSTVRSNNFDVQTSAVLFSGLTKVNTIKQNSINLLASQYDLDVLKNSISLAVAGYFLDMLLNLELYDVANNQIEITRSQVVRISKMVEAGSSAKGDLLNIQAQESAEALTVIQAQNRLYISSISLQQLIDLPVTTEFRVEKPLLKPVEKPDKLLTPEQVFNLAVEKRPEIKSADLRVQSAMKSLAIARGVLSPSLSFAGTWGTGYSGASEQVESTVYQRETIGITNISRDTVFGYYPSNTYKTRDFGTQMVDNQNKSLGFYLRIPIFNGWTGRTNISLAKIQQEKAELDLEIQKRDLRKNIEQAYADASSSLQQYNASLQRVSAQEESFKYTQQKFDVGMMTSFDFNNSKKDLTKAQSDLLQAKYDFIFKTTILDFYMGKPISINK
ncbi:MAG: TolC family protein [Bacteroidetes bacterium]|nr:TolC family protein [Bacteroidota bacterium]